MTRSARLVTVLAVAAALLNVAGCRKLEARDQLNKGVQNYKAMKYERAIENFKNAVSLDNDLEVAKLYLATALMQQYVPGIDTPDNNAYAQQAIDEYKEVLRGNSKSVTALKGIASLYMNMKNFNESGEYYKRAIDADPNDPEAYYSVGVIDWTAVYKDIAERKSKVGLGVEDQAKGKQFCEDVKAADGPRIDEGLKMLQTAMEKRQDYDDAMTYTNLLYHRKADTECGDAQAYAADLKSANDWSDKAMNARKKKFDEAAKKNNGGIAPDQKK
ncbi:MAG TPA: tetratricopeptide repeat protein [Candidatus Angelobacter sp.]